MAKSVTSGRSKWGRLNREYKPLKGRSEFFSIFLKKSKARPYGGTNC